LKCLNRRHLKTRKQIEKAVKKATHGARPYLRVTVHETTTSERVQVGRDRPGPDTRYEEKETVHYHLK